MAVQEVFGATEDGKRQIWNGMCSHAGALCCPLPALYGVLAGCRGLLALVDCDCSVRIAVIQIGDSKIMMSDKVGIVSCRSDLHVCMCFVCLIIMLASTAVATSRRAGR